MENDGGYSYYDCKAFHNNPHGSVNRFETGKLLDVCCRVTAGKTPIPLQYVTNTTEIVSPDVNLLYNGGRNYHKFASEFVTNIDPLALMEGLTAFVNSKEVDAKRAKEMLREGTVVISIGIGNHSNSRNNRDQRDGSLAEPKVQGKSAVKFFKEGVIAVSAKAVCKIRDKLLEHNNCQEFQDDFHKSKFATLLGLVLGTDCVQTEHISLVFTGPSESLKATRDVLLSKLSTADIDDLKADGNIQLHVDSLNDWRDGFNRCAVASVTCLLGDGQMPIRKSVITAHRARCAGWCEDTVQFLPAVINLPDRLNDNAVQLVPAEFSFWLKASHTKVP